MANDLEDRFLAQCREAGLPEPDREYRFCPGRQWRSDFAFLDRKLLVEVEGGTYGGGRHTSGPGYQSDCEKYNTAAALGWTVFRFTTAMFRRGEAVQFLIGWWNGTIVVPPTPAQRRNANVSHKASTKRSPSRKKTV